jgi:hypothetical protein
VIYSSREGAAMHKPVLMIHTVTEEIFTLPLDRYVLTFDDGLYSQFFYYPRFRDIPTPKIYFISTGILCTGTQSTVFPPSNVAHDKARAGNMEDFMTVDQVQELSLDPWVTIGGHSHSHERASSLGSLAERVAFITHDFSMMKEWFSQNLDYMPTAFCYPYNDDCSGIYTILAKREGFTSLYGRERIRVEQLLSGEQIPA